MSRIRHALAAVALSAATALVLVPASPATASTPASAPTAVVGGQLTNGCTYSSRGIPSCGAYAGGAYNSNTDPSSWESGLTGRIGVRRTYFGPTQVASAVAVARTDAANHRISWMSFKAPYSWADMAKGRGDAWARDIASKLGAIKSPVWVAIHHEPENDGGDIRQWTAMQERLAPIFRSQPTIAFSVILMGWHQLYGDAKFRFAAMWPKTTVDVAGFDIYDEYGLTKGGKTVTKHKDFRGRYFEPLQAWAKKTGVRWGLAETGFSASSLSNSPSIMGTTYRDLVATGGVAYSYFNTNLNASTDWRLNTTTRRAAFAAVHRTSATAGASVCSASTVRSVPCRPARPPIKPLTVRGLVR